MVAVVSIEGILPRIPMLGHSRRNACVPVRPAEGTFSVPKQGGHYNRGRSEPRSHKGTGNRAFILEKASSVSIHYQAGVVEYSG